MRGLSLDRKWNAGRDVERKGSEVEERIELRCQGGPLLGILVVEMARGCTADGEPMSVIRKVLLEVKRGRQLFEVDVLKAVSKQEAAVLECALDPIGEASHAVRAQANRRMDVGGTSTLSDLRLDDGRASS
jgi:hypothetical protein